MRNLIVVGCLAMIAVAQNTPRPGSAAGVPQSNKPDFAAQVPSPRAEDVRTLDGILRAIYDVISGPAGDRDWNRLRSLFVPQARFTRTGKLPDGSVPVRLFGMEDFVQVATDVFKKEPFYENAIVNKVQTYGSVAQVFSSYDSRRAPGEKPFQRGLNSIQLFNDGERWWVLSILWDEERPDNLLPAEFATAKK